LANPTYQNKKRKEERKMNNYFKNNFARKFKNSKKAISPAIAIALLLAITISLVAAVGYSATVVTPSISAAPQAAFDVNIYTDSGMVIKQLSGDTITTKDLSIKTIYNGVETVVKPTGNNTFYLNWVLFNPPLANKTNYLYNVTSGELYEGEGSLKPAFNPEGTKELTTHFDWATGCIPNPADPGEPLDVTAIGVQLTNAQAPDDPIPLKNWLENGIKVDVLNSATNKWVSAGSSATYPATSNYTEAWYGVKSEFAMFYVPNDDNTAYTGVRITSPYGESVTYLKSDTNANTNGYRGEALESGDAFFFRLSEFNSPFLWEARSIPTDKVAASFGHYTLQAGTVMQSVSLGAGYGTDSNHAVISNWDNVAVGDVVKVYILYNPSSQIIWQGDVAVQ
jgi:hypothetical protein